MKVNKTKHLVQLKIDLRSTERKFCLVFTMVAFAILFTTIFEPFGLYADKANSAGDVFIEISIAMLVAFVVLLVSQFALREIFKIKYFSLRSVFFWFIFESVLVASAWTLLDIIETHSIINSLEKWTNNLVFYILLMFIPHSLYLSYIVVVDRFKQLKNDHETKLSQSKSTRTFIITDENLKTQLSVSENSLLYIQSADNYLEVHYLKNNLHEKQLIRNSIKTVERIFDGSNIIRCHRSFIVNTTQVELAKREGSSYQLELKTAADIQIPVSKSYQSEVRKHFLKTS